MSGPENGPALVPAFATEQSQVSVKPDLLPAVSALSLLSLFGLPLGWVWSRLAPPQQSTVVDGGATSSVLMESYHSFDALAIFLLLSGGLGVLVGGAAWMLRSRRGPVFLLGAVLGAAVAGWLGMRLGTAFAAGLYALPAASQVGDLVTVAPSIDTPWVVLMAPLGVALAYGLAASWNGMDDLGRRH
ncbi:DUF2567 domain-containing protein [Allosaccharopolyspora coralli]|uniref:DUF2567 domain-containing protein n=1 Tax=Allosaccharopolyspora coralli TaxID=2665642 RepID=A0A5Q3QEG9_9PSEU|nr:DUF2567 domain-containing protein [Allosaccharopolyspora coralli]